MPEEDPDLLADDGDHDQSRSRSPFPAMSERYRLTEELENARYQNNLLVQKCRELEEKMDMKKLFLSSLENRIRGGDAEAYHVWMREKNKP